MSHDEHDICRLFHAIFNKSIALVDTQVSVDKETDRHPDSKNKKNVPTHICTSGAETVTDKTGNCFDVLLQPTTLFPLLLDTV